jgi:hypothetical protein
VEHRHRYGAFSTIRIPCNEYNTFAGRLCESLRFCERLQPRLQILPYILLTDEDHITQDGIKEFEEINYQYKEFAVLGTEGLHTRQHNAIFNSDFHLTRAMES